MDQLKNLIETLKEKLKQSWAETQDAPWFIDLKERFEQAPPAVQKTAPWAVAALLLIFILWWPLSNLMDASDLNTRFDERRQILKDLLRLERDLANQPPVPLAPAPTILKGQMDQKLTTAGIKPDQIKVGGAETPTRIVQGAEEHGIEYKLGHVTIRQAIDLSYELEHTEPSLRLNGLEFLADPTDPHFYEVDIKLVNFAPKIAAAELPGAGLVNAIKGGKGAPAPGGPAEAPPQGGGIGAPPPTSLPPPPAMPPPPGGGLNIPKFAPPPRGKTG